MGIINRGSKSAGGTSFATGKGTIKSTEVDTDIDTVYNEVNGSLNGENISGIASTKLTDSTSTGRSLIAAADAEAARNVIVTPGPAQMRGYIAGYTMSIDDSPTNDDINITAGVAVDSTQTAFMQRAEITKRLDSTWVAGDDAGGFPDGLSLASGTWYHFFVISNAAGTTVDAGFDTSVTATNLLADTAVADASLTLYRRVGSILTDGSSKITDFKQVGDLFAWDVPSEHHDVTNPGSSARTVTLTVPTGVVVRPNTMVWLTNVSTTARYGLFTALDQTDTAASADNATYYGRGNASIVYGIAMNFANTIYTNTSGQIRLRLSGSDADVAEHATTHGWIDSRGKDD